MTKPYLFLDVDGVLNRIATSGGDWDDFELHKLSPFNYGKFRVFLSKSMCAALAELPVEIIWLTTWCTEADRLIAPLMGLPGYRCAGMGDPFPNSKITCLEIFLEKEGIRPFIWIDDGAIKTYMEEDFRELGWKHLAIRPNERIGITKNHINQIKEFLAELES